VALQDAGVALPMPTMAVRLVSAPPAPPSRPGLPGRKPTAAREEASTREHQRLDSVAASESSATNDAQPSVFDQAMNVARDLPGDEGENLLEEGEKK
jgi:hypothetical protein